MQAISAPAFDFNIRVMLFSSAPMAALRALDVPGVTVCDIVSDARSLPERIARMQPHVLVLGSAACHPAALCESILRANPSCPPRVLACFDTDAPLDLPSVSDLPACVRNMMCLPYGRLAAPSIPDRLSCAERLLDALGMPRTLRGYAAIAYGAALLSAFPPPAPPAHGWLYPLLAQRAQCSEGAVERRIRSAVESTWLRGSLQSQSALFGLSISPERGKPTNAELLCRLAVCVCERLYTS